MPFIETKHYLSDFENVHNIVKDIIKYLMIGVNKTPNRFSSWHEMITLHEMNRKP